MRRRWHDWVIVISIILIGVSGAVAIWGDDIVALVRDVNKPPDPAPTETPVAPPVELPPGGTPI